MTTVKLNSIYLQGLAEGMVECEQDFINHVERIEVKITRAKEDLGLFRIKLIAFGPDCENMEASFLVDDRQPMTLSTFCGYIRHELQMIERWATEAYDHPVSSVAGDPRM